MYHLNMTITGSRTPWLLPFESRMCVLQEARASGLRCIVAVYNRPDDSTFRYRVYNVFRALENSRSFRLCYFFENELSCVSPQLELASALLLCRTLWTPEIQKAIDTARVRGIPVLFDVDDRIFDLDCLQLFASTLDLSLEDDFLRNFWMTTIAAVYMTAKQADGFTTTNAFLGSCLQDKFGKPFVCIENSLNEEQLSVSAELRKRKAEISSDGDFVMGYFSGSPTHVNDLKTALPELVALLNRFEKMKLMIAGHMEMPAELDGLVEAGKISMKPFVDFQSLQVQIAQVDLNVVPMVENSFTDCKSELKFFESAAVDVPTCAAPVYSYRHSIQDKKTGFLCSQGQWYPTISDIYAGKYDLRAINDSARDYVMARYSGGNFRASVENAYDSILRQIGGEA